MQGFRERAGQGVGLLAKRRDIGSVRAAHDMLAVVFTNLKCPAALRAALARAYYSLMSALARCVPEAQVKNKRINQPLLLEALHRLGTTLAPPWHRLNSATQP